LAGLATHGTGEKAEYIHGGAQIILARQVQGLAAVQRFQAGEVVGLFFNGVGNPQQDVRALLRRGPRPTGKGAMSGEDGAFDLLAAGFGDLGENFTAGRVDDRLAKPLALDQLAVDQQRSEQRGGRAGHFSRSLFLCGHGRSLTRRLTFSYGIGRD